MTAPSRPEPRLLLGLVLAAALVLRLVGIDWGLPDAHHLYSYHPDEWQMVEGALGLAARGEANPRFFNYPSLTIYVLWFVTIPLRLFGAGVGGHYLAARLLGVLYALLTIVVADRLGTRLAGRRVGLVAAGLLAVAPLHVVNSRFATVDGPLTCAVTIALWCAVELSAAAPVRRWRWLLAGSIAAGLAAGCKYNGLLALVPIWTVIGQLHGRAGWRSAMLATGVALGVFLLTSPYLLLDFGAAWPAVRFELFEHPRQSNLFAGVGPGWWFHLTRNLPTAAGGPWAIAALAGLILMRRDRRALPVLLLGLVLAASLLRTKELFIRYWLPLLPVLAVAAAAAVGRLRSRPLLTSVVLLAIAAGPALRSRAYAAMLSRPDARDRALTWCRQTIDSGAEVGLDGQPWFWSVPLTPNNGGARTAVLGYESAYELQPDPAAWPSTRPAWLVINRTHWDEGLAAAESDRVLTGYEAVARFANEAHVLPGWTETGEGSRRHDWNYIWPRIEIYRRTFQVAPLEAPGSGSPESTAP